MIKTIFLINLWLLGSLVLSMAVVIAAGILIYLWSVFARFVRGLYHGKK